MILLDTFIYLTSKYQGWFTFYIICTGLGWGEIQSGEQSFGAARKTNTKFYDANICVELDRDVDLCKVSYILLTKKIHNSGKEFELRCQISGYFN